MSTGSVALVVGVGSNIGTHVAKAFAAKGYQVATVSRSPTIESVAENNNVHLQADLANPAEVEGVFAKVRVALGEPSVVVYNGGQLRMTAAGNRKS